jgi:hypothetical protein
MTTTTSPAPSQGTGAGSQGFTAASFLFGEGKDSLAALSDALGTSGVLGAATASLTKLASAGRDAVGDQIAAVAHGLLDLDLGGIVLQGWGKFADLLEAARNTVEPPGSSAVVELASHEITSEHEPTVELLVDGVPLVNLEFELALAFAVTGVVTTVQDGRLVRVNSGTCEVSGSLSAQGKQLVERSGHFNLPGIVHLGSGVPLLGDRLASALAHPSPDDAAPDTSVAAESVADVSVADVSVAEVSPATGPSVAGTPVTDEPTAQAGA